MVAICDYPSTGLGMEIYHQGGIRKGSLLAFARSDSKVTRMVMDPPYPHYTFYRYDNFDEIYQIVIGAIGDELQRRGFERPVSA